MGGTRQLVQLETVGRAWSSRVRLVHSRAGLQAQGGPAATAVCCLGDPICRTPRWDRSCRRDTVQLTRTRKA